MKKAILTSTLAALAALILVQAVCAGNHGGEMIVPTYYWYGQPGAGSSELMAVLDQHFTRLPQPSIHSTSRVNAHSWVYPDPNPNNVTATAGQVSLISPTLNLTRWANTTFLQVMPTGATIWTGISQSKGVVTVSAEDETVTMAPVHDLPGFEYNITLARIPASNIFTFGLTSAGLDFFYQPPLDQLFLGWPDAPRLPDRCRERDDGDEREYGSPYG